MCTRDSRMRESDCQSRCASALICPKLANEALAGYLTLRMRAGACTMICSSWTPLPTVSALRAGYRAQLHPSGIP